MEQSSVSNNLHDALVNKNSTMFWKIWKNKFNTNQSHAKIIEGSSDETQIANGFANFFDRTRNTDIEQIMLFKKQFTDQYNNYDFDCKQLPICEIHLIDSLVTNMTKGKSAGVDFLTCEHLQYSHPIVISMITKLFNLMVWYNYVPNDFGRGIIIPIPKDKDSKMQDKMENYRGITISPVISKLFEQCLLHFLRPYLFSSERQFWI